MCAARPGHTDNQQQSQSKRLPQVTLNSVAHKQHDSSVQRLGTRVVTSHNGLCIMHVLRMCYATQVPVAHGKADLTIYRDAGAAVLAVLSAAAVTERASIDEASSHRRIIMPPSVVLYNTVQCSTIQYIAVHSVPSVCLQCVQPA